MTVTASEPTAVEASLPTRTSRLFPWIVFTLTFGLFLADYMSRQVLAAVFPLLKAQWALTDTELGSLTSIVGLTVGILAVPLSLLGDRWGRTRALVLMAVIWSLAALGSAVAANYGQLLAARFLIGIGGAAFGSIGLAVVLTVFPAHRRASLTGTFAAGGAFGSVLGAAFAAQFGWRGAFAAMGIFGLLLAAAYLVVIRQSQLDTFKIDDAAGNGPQLAAGRPRASLTTLFTTPAVILAYVSGGLQLFVPGALFAWLPSYLDRTVGMDPKRAAGVTAVYLLIIGTGMIICGMIADRISRQRPIRMWTSSVVYAMLSLGFVGTAFALAPGGLQLLLLAIGCFFVAGTSGPSGAIVAQLTHQSIRATAFGIAAFFNSGLGLACGSLATGILADRLGLQTAMKHVPLISVVVIALLLTGRAAYPSSLRKLQRTAAQDNQVG